MTGIDPRELDHDALAVALLAAKPVLARKLACACAVDDAGAHPLLREVLRFISPCAATPSALTPSPRVDAAWHERPMERGRLGSLARLAASLVVAAAATAGCGPPKIVPERDVSRCEGARWYTMPANGMAPTIEANEAVAWVAYESDRSASVGDVVLFNAGGADVFVQRVVGVGPTTVSFDRHLLSIANAHAVEHAALPDPCVGLVETIGCTVFRERHPQQAVSWRVQRLVESEGSSAPPTGQWEVPGAHVFVAGDNRMLSDDSRVGGVEGTGRPLPLEVIMGRAVAVERAGLCLPIDSA